MDRSEGVTDLGFCWWIEDECGKTLWPNPRARFKGRKPLTDQEVSAHNAFIPSSSPAPSCASLAASPSPPQDTPRGIIRELWHSLERIFGIPLTIHQRWCSKRQPFFTPFPFTCKSTTETGNIEDNATVAEKTLNIIICEAEGNEGFIPDSMSAAMELSCPVESVSNSARLTVAEEEGADDRPLQGMGTQVKITVAIQAAEDDEPEDELCSNHLDFGGSGSEGEDEVVRHEKSSGAGASGGELEEELWDPPDPELTEKLVTQIEFYLSDENLEHDAFLLKHVRRNKLGFVSVKLLTSFKKVKHLTRDWRTTAYALQQSTLLELNEEGRKVRRRTPVPIFPSESLPSRMLLLSELQSWPELGVALRGGAGDGGGEGGGVTQQERLMELLLKAFGTYGPIASVRVLKPGKELPADLRKLSGRYTQLGTEECAIVEFEEVEAAVKAHEAVCADEEGMSTMGVKVVLIGTKPPKKKVPKDRPREEGGMRKSRSLNSRVRELQYLDESTCSSSETESNPTSPRLVRKTQSLNKLSPTGGGASFLQNNHLSPGVSPRSSPWSSPRVSPRASPCPQRKSPHINRSPLANEGRLSPESGRRWADYSSDSSLTPSGSPWVQRRRQVASLESSPVGSPMLGRKIQNADGLPPGVVRLPRGPDGTRGFHSASVGERAVVSEQIPFPEASGSGVV
ncbi:hypothetical protein JZ751_018250 [Albula glossodonta]|uniref:La-related protein 6 n=1 Tax=Albula glossodonta TaxID=121402 RepID=A0A8T2NMB0_9TELE|nr:hypothetical protein JZ751_018250 [Albula glossodonta]